MDNETSLQERSGSQSTWKSLKRELAAVDIVASSYLIAPMEFVKTKHNCYVVKEYANGGTLAQLLLYRSQMKRSPAQSSKTEPKGNLSENETKRVIRDVLCVISDVFSRGLAIWDLSPETLLLQIN